MPPLLANPNYTCLRCTRSLARHTGSLQFLQRNIVTHTEPPKRDAKRDEERFPNTGDLFPSYNTSQLSSRRKVSNPRSKTTHSDLPQIPNSPNGIPSQRTFSGVRNEPPDAPLSNNSQKSPGKYDGWNWYWETLPPTARQKSWADEFFTNKDGDPKFLRAISKFRDWPESNLPEVAFVGRSNTGKSTLLNTLVNRPVKVLAHTSKTPGRTKTMNIYGVGAASDNGVRIKEGRGGEHDRIMGRGGLVIVDLPGYGEGSFAEWGTEILKYLVGRRQLRRTFVLIDPLHGLKDNDRAFLSRLRLDGVSHQIILPKMDRVFIPKSSLNVESLGKKAKSKGSIEELHYIMKSLRQEIQPKRGSGALGEILACSSQVGVQGRRLGIDSVRYAMLQAAGLGPGAPARLVEQGS